MYTYETNIRTRLYMTFLVWMIVQTPGAYAPSQHKRLHPEHSLLFPQPNDPNLWNLDGTARFRYGGLNLVPSRSYVAGLAWNGIPVDYCNWELNIAFVIHSSTYPRADGWALFYTEEPITKLELDPYKSTMGGPYDYKGIALIYDTYDNNWRLDGAYPRLYPVLLNGDYKYNHYDDGYNQRPYSINYRCINEKCKVRFEYWNRSLCMTAVDWNGEWVDERKSKNVILPAGGYFSFTAFNTFYRARLVGAFWVYVEEATRGSTCDMVARRGKEDIGCGSCWFVPATWLVFSRQRKPTAHDTGEYGSES